jgi:hypothetical protein
MAEKRSWLTLEGLSPHAPLGMQNTLSVLMVLRTKARRLALGRRGPQLLHLCTTSGTQRVVSVAAQWTTDRKITATWSAIMCMHTSPMHLHLSDCTTLFLCRQRQCDTEPENTHSKCTFASLQQCMVVVAPHRVLGVVHFLSTTYQLPGIKP